MEIRAVRFAVYNGKHSGNPPHTSMQNIREKDRHRTRFRHEMNRCTWKHAARSRTNVRPLCSEGGRSPVSRASLVTDKSRRQIECTAT